MTQIFLMEINFRTVLTSFCCFLLPNSFAFAADIIINSAVTSTQILNESGQNITIGAGGSITTTGGLKAISIQGGGNFTVDNDGTLNNAIEILDGSDVVINNTKNLSTGNINVLDGSKAVINNQGTIYSNLYLGSNSGSSLNHESGLMYGSNIYAQASGQVINLNGGSFDRVIINLAEGSLVSINTNDYLENLDLNIRGSDTNIGTLRINENITFSNSAGETSYLGAYVTNLNNIEVLDGATFNVYSIVTSKNISLLGNLNIYSTSAFSSAINGYSANQGNVSFVGTLDNTLGIGAENAISQLEINSGSTLNNRAVLSANNILVGGVLTLDSSTVTGSINGSSANTGTVSIISGETFTNSSAIGETNALSNLNIVGTLNTGANISANNINLSNTGTLNLTGSKTVTGAIDGSAANQGTVVVASGSSFSNSSAIGSANALSNLNIIGTLNASANISANSTLVSGSLNLGNTARTITGDVTGSGAGLLNIGSASHTVNGNLTLNSGDTLKVSIANISGKGAVSGITTIDNGVKLVLALSDSDNNYEYIPEGTKYTLIEGESGSAINKISDSNIAVNSSESNKFSVFAFTTSTADDNLFLDVNRKSAALVTTNKSAQNVYDIVNTIGNSATGILKKFQQHIDNSGSAAEVESALKSVTPQVDNGVLLGSVNVVNNSVATVENRLDAMRNIGHSANISTSSQALTPRPIRDNSAKKTPIYKLISGIPSRATSSQTYAPKVPATKIIDTKAPTNSSTPVYKLKTGISSGDKIQDSSTWAQTFGTTAKQGDLGGNDGYKSKALGFAFGYDKEISKDTRLGVSLSYANSTISGKNDLKKTNIDTYQINAYGGKTFGKYFVDSIIGFSWNEYDSSRIISSVNSQANANYNGRSYVAKIRTGVNQVLGNGFSISPNASLNYVHNSTSDYTETGADTLSLQVKGSSTNFLEARVGTTLSYETVTKKGTKVTPKVIASYGNNFLSSTQTISSNFVGQAVTFNTVSAKLDPRSLKIGAGIDLYDLDSMTISAEYIMEMKQKYQSHSGLLKAKYDF